MKVYKKVKEIMTNEGRVPSFKEFMMIKYKEELKKQIVKDFKTQLLTQSDEFLVSKQEFIDIFIEALMEIKSPEVEEEDCDEE